MLVGISIAILFHVAGVSGRFLWFDKLTNRSKDYHRGLFSNNNHPVD